MSNVGILTKTSIFRRGKEQGNIHPCGWQECPFYDEPCFHDIDYVVASNLKTWGEVVIFEWLFLKNPRIVLLNIHHNAIALLRAS